METKTCGVKYSDMCDQCIEDLIEDFMTLSPDELEKRKFVYPEIVANVEMNQTEIAWENYQSKWFGG